MVVWERSDRCTNGREEVFGEGVCTLRGMDDLGEIGDGDDGHRWSGGARRWETGQEGLRRGDVELHFGERSKESEGGCRSSRV